VLSVSYEYTGEAKPIAEYPHFELQRQALSQTIVSTVPLGMGPFFVLAGFPKRWEVATIRPLAAVTRFSPTTSPASRRADIPQPIARPTSTCR
jgi:hypothetical protein